MLVELQDRLSNLEVHGCTTWDWLTTEVRGNLTDNLRDILGPTPLECVAKCVEAWHGELDPRDIGKPITR